MPPPSTLRGDRLRGAEHCTYELPLKLPEVTSHYLWWHALTVVLWSGLGVYLADMLPMPLPCVPLWLFVRLGWPLVLLFFALRFYRHNLFSATAMLPPEERKPLRARLQRAAFWRALLLPVLWPWALFYVLRDFPLLCRAWLSWQVYDKDSTPTVGTLRSPAGDQPSRVWHFRLTLVLVAAGTLDAVAWPPPHSLGPAKMAGFLCLALLMYTPGLLTVLVTSVVIAPSLRVFKEIEREEHL